MPVWKRIKDAGSGYLYELSEALAIVQLRYPNLLIPVSDSPMTIVSDYSGQHKQASHEAYSFLVTTERGLDAWKAARVQFRHRWLPDGRRMSFKNLSEPSRRRALIPFLDLAGIIRGNLLTFLVDRRIGSFIAGGTAAIADVFPDCFDSSTKPSTIEKMFRVSGFVAMINACLRDEKQRSLWISDHDETLETFERREQLGRLASYLTFGLARWSNPADQQFGTTESEHAPDWAEDAAAIPDLFAGAYCRLCHVLPAYVGKETWLKILPDDQERDPRAREIGNWCAMRRTTLRQVLLRLELDTNGAVHASAQFIAGGIERGGLIVD